MKDSTFDLWRILAAVGVCVASVSFSASGQVTLVDGSTFVPYGRIPEECGCELVRQGEREVAKMYLYRSGSAGSFKKYQVGKPSYSSLDQCVADIPDTSACPSR